MFFGKVLGIQALIFYEGTTAKELIADFHEAVDAYFELCKETNEEPERAYKGSFNIRISPDLHKQIAGYALSHQVSLNSLVERALQNFVMMQM